ncbi:MAG: SAM-dependent methyltransferase [Clostridia bacterium]|nr:SAM-dependent methyltransferase [Clostridia bacterium]
MHNTGQIVLDPRLSMIARLVGGCESYADIGCDHGRLGAFMLQSGQCRQAILTDISEPSLRKARSLIGILGLTDRVEFAVGDGALALTRPVDAVVIAGMGGATIAQIVGDGRERLGDARLILQPNVAAPQLRGALAESGYAIYDERVVQDGRRNYVIICARPGKADYGLKQCVVGPVLLERLPAELTPYARFRLRVAKKALAGASASGDAAQTAPLEREIAIWEEVLACLQR